MVSILTIIWKKVHLNATKDSFTSRRDLENNLNEFNEWIQWVQARVNRPNFCHKSLLCFYYETKSGFMFLSRQFINAQDAA